MVKTSINKEIKKTLNNMIGQNIYIWIKSTFTLPLLSLGNFNWDYKQVTNLDEQIILHGEDEQILTIMVDEIYDIISDDFLNEIVIYMENDSMIQIWSPNI